MMDRLAWCIKQAVRLVECKAPAAIKAHLVFRVLMPRIVAEIGVAECRDEALRLFSDMLADQAGLCWVCKKVYPVRGENLCVKCLAECDQLSAEVGL